MQLPKYIAEIPFSICALVFKSFDDKIKAMKSEPLITFDELTLLIKSVIFLSICSLNSVDVVCSIFLTYFFAFDPFHNH